MQIFIHFIKWILVLFICFGFVVIYANYLGPSTHLSVSGYLIIYNPLSPAQILRLRNAMFLWTSYRNSLERVCPIKSIFFHDAYLYMIIEYVSKNIEYRVIKDGFFHANRLGDS